MLDVEPVLQTKDYNCAMCVGAYISRCYGIFVEPDEIEEWINKRRGTINWVPASGNGAFDEEIGIWLTNHGFITGRLLVPRSRFTKFDAPYNLDAVWNIVQGLICTTSVMYTTKGIKDPTGLHLRAVDYNGIMCPKFGRLPLTRENFFRMPEPGPCAQTWDLYWVYRE